MTCARGSGVTRMNPFRIAAIAPLSVRTFKRRMAPNTIQRIDAAMTTPSIDAASTCRTGTSQTRMLTPAVIARLNGMAVAADKRRITRSPKTASSGVRAANSIGIAIGAGRTWHSGASGARHNVSVSSHARTSRRPQ